MVHDSQQGAQSDSQETAEDADERPGDGDKVRARGGNTSPAAAHQHAQEQQQEQGQELPLNGSAGLEGRLARSKRGAQHGGNQLPETSGKGKADRPKLPRPEGQQPCPRCASMETKFCYFNNYNVKQPRYYCRACQRYWTAGGALRDVPVGAGRRKTKATTSYDGPETSTGISMGTMPGMLSAALPMDPLAAFNLAAGQSVGAVMPALLPSSMATGMMFPHADSLGQRPVTASAGESALQSYIGAGGAPGIAERPRLVDAAEDGAVEGRRTRAKTASAAELAGRHVAGPVLSTSAPAMAAGVGLPYGMAAMDWFTAAGQSAAAAMQAQFQAATGYGQAQFGMPAMWPYPGFPSWGGYPRFPGLNPMDPAAVAAANGAPPTGGAEHSALAMQGAAIHWAGMSAGWAAAPSSQREAQPAAPAVPAVMPTAGDEEDHASGGADAADE